MKKICKICNKEFFVKSNDLRPNRYNTCSSNCRNIHRKKIRRNSKYTEDQINQVISLKKQFKNNSEISKITGVNLNTIKSIVKENNLFLTKEQAQKNSYEKKLNKNPNCMAAMRKAYADKTKSNESLSKVIDYLKNKGFTYISGFKQKTKPFIVRCDKCLKEKQISKVYTVAKDKCVNCLGDFKTSSTELEIGNFIYSLGILSEKYTIPKTHGREIDIYISEKQIGIEYCGLYWHNENSPSPRDRLYHHSKMKQAENEGIRLITIFEDEWLNRRYQVESFLIAALGKCSQTYYARKCDVRPVDKKAARDMLDKYHIQGSGIIEIAFGIFNNDDLLGVVTGSKHHRGVGNGVFVLNRLVFKKDVNVIGGAGKLNKALLQYCKQNNYKKLISWSDNRWSQGDVYKKLGFYLEQELLPDYSYIVKAGVRESKQSNTKKLLLKKGAEGGTEAEMATSLGYSKIWDCGKKRWAITIE